MAEKATIKASEISSPKRLVCNFVTFYFKGRFLYITF